MQVMRGADARGMGKAMSPTAVKTTYFSSRKFEARLKVKLRLLAIKRSDMEQRNVTLEEVHNEVVTKGLEALGMKV